MGYVIEIDDWPKMAGCNITRTWYAKAASGTKDSDVDTSMSTKPVM